MLLPRRRFLLASAASLLPLLAVSPVSAAGATRSRLFVSQWRLGKIAWHFALGVFKQLANALDLEQLAKDLVSGGAHAKLETLSKEAAAINVTIDNFQVHLNGVPPRLAAWEIAKAFLKFAKEVLPHHEKLDEQEIHEVLSGLVEEFRQFDPNAELRISYRLHSAKMNFALYKTLSFRRGHVRMEASIPQPVGQLNCLDYVLDAEEKCGQTYITNTLGLDVCLGIREGRIVRRIAGRVIGNKEAELLCQLEGLVDRVIHGTEDPDALGRIIPEIMRRVETQQFTG